MNIVLNIRRALWLLIIVPSLALMIPVSLWVTVVALLFAVVSWIFSGKFDRWPFFMWFVMLDLVRSFP